jgi:signal transduction histidine kinase
LLNDLARQAAPAVHAHRLAADLQRSRERLVIAREEERRRLRRDLHDGFGPSLASQALKLDAALDLLDADPATARRLLEEVKAHTQSTVADVRQLVYALRPPALDQLGLVGALNAQIQALALNGLSVTVDAAPMPPLSAAVEVAAYRIALEAVTNSARHARASESVVRLTVHDGALEIEVTDNGAGLPAGSAAGVGLVSMRERAAELGGDCTIENIPSGGLRVGARLPLVAAEHG